VKTPSLVCGGFRGSFDSCLYLAWILCTYFEDTVWVVVHTLCELARMSIHTALRAYEFLNQNLLP